MESRHKPPSSSNPLKCPVVVPNQHLTQESLRRNPMKTRKQYSHELPADLTDVFKSSAKSNEKCSSSVLLRRNLSLPRRKSSSESQDMETPSLTYKSKSLHDDIAESPAVPTSHLSLPMKLAKLSLSSEHSEVKHPPSACPPPPPPKILINDEAEPRKNLDSMPRRPLKRKSQDHDRNYLSECGYAGLGSRNSDFWLPKVKVTPSMVTQLNAEILANIHISSIPDTVPDDKERIKCIRESLEQFLVRNQTFGSEEQIVEVIENVSTRVLSPSDDEMWTVLTREQVLIVEIPHVGLNATVPGYCIPNLRIVERCPILQIQRILTDLDLTVVHLVGPEMAIILGNSAKTEKLISSVVVSSLRLRKSLPPVHSVPMEMDNNQPNPPAPALVRCCRSSTLSSPDFLEVTRVPILDLPNVNRAFRELYPDEKQIFYTSIVIVSFEEMARDIEVPVRIQVSAESNDFRPSVLKLMGASLSFCNPMRTFFAFNPGPNLTNIDVSNSIRFSVERTESPKPHSLLMVHNGKSYVVETGDGNVAEEIFQRITMLQHIFSNGIGRQVAHIFITKQSLVAFRTHNYTNIFQVPLMNVVKIHTPMNQEATCTLELESTEAMDFVSSDSPCWSLTFVSLSAKKAFVDRLITVAPSLAQSLLSSKA